jgi:periplasmic protein CpxP/Spy
MSLNNGKRFARLLFLATTLCLTFAATTFAQGWRDGRDDGPGGGPPMARSFHGMQRGRWWDNPRLAERIGLTDDQKKKMDDIFLQSRLQLIDLNATVEKQEAVMQPLISADQPDESKILSQIDAIAQARAELEKSRARMLFGIRKVLTPEQWKKVQAMVHEDHGPMGRDGRGPGNWGPRDGNSPQGQKTPPPPGE